MKTYLIAYKLERVTEDPGPLLDRIKSFTSWWNDGDSVWMVTSELAPDGVRDELSSVMHGGQLLVVDVTGSSWAHQGLGAEGSDWLKEHVKP